MAQPFNLTAQINLRAPGNLKPVVDTIRRELGSITADVKVRIDPKSAKSVDTVTKKLQTMNSVLVASTNNTNSLNAALQSLSASLSKTSSSSTKVSASLKNNATTAKGIAKNFNEASSQMEEFGRQAFLATKRFAAFSIVTVGIYGLINAVKSGVGEFIKFDKTLVTLQQVTGKGAIGINRLEKEIRNLAQNLGVSSNELSEVSKTLSQAGLSADETRVALEALAKSNLAPSFDNIRETAEGAIAAIRQFGLEVSELEGALGSINAVSKAFAVESSDIISAIQRTGGVFASASKGVSEGSDALNEFVAIFTSVRATTRESAETIATGLRTIFTRIQRSSTVDELKKFGVELRDLEGKFVGPFEAVKRLSAALNQLDPRSGEFSGIIEELGGFRQIGKVIPLIQQFAVAQEALKVAQRGQNSLTEDATTAQKSLAIQIIKVREQFLALIGAIGKSNTFQVFFGTVLNLTSGLISLASAFKPILPFLAILGTIKGIGAITQFVGGFSGALSKKPTAKSGVSSLESEKKDKSDSTEKKAQAIVENVAALTKNTSSIDSLSTSVNSLIDSINSNTSALNGGSGGATLNAGGKVLGFARGGVVPGSGNGDTVPAMLQPGEFVIRKKAVETLGMDQLHSMNKYAKGGKAYYGAKQRKVPFEAGVGPSPFDSPKQKTDYYSLENSSGFKSGEFDMLVQYAKTSDFNLEEFASYIEKRKQQKLSRYAIGGRIEDEIAANMNVSRMSDGKNIKAFGLAGLYAGSAKEGSFGVSGQKNIKLFAETSKEQDAVLYTSSLNTSATGQGITEIEEDLQQSYIKTVDKFAKAIAEKIQGKTLNIKDVLDEQAFSVVSGNAFESAIRSIGAPFLEKTEKTKSLDFPLGLGSAASLFENIPSNVPTDVTRTVGGKGKGETAIIGQIERFIESVDNTEFTKAQNKQIEQQQKQVSQVDLPYEGMTTLLRKIKDKFPGNNPDGSRWNDVLTDFGLFPKDLAKVAGVDNFHGYGKLGNKAPEFLQLLEDNGIIQSKNSGGRIRNVQALASGGPVKLYHGSNSGPDDSILNSFKEKGILSNIASGYGQGSGFFMWSDKNSAVKHAKNLVDPNSNMTTSATTGGRPMIVEATETLDPKNWDLDYELQNKDIIDYIYANFDSLKPLLDKSQGVDLGDGLKNFQFKNKIDEYIDPNDNTTMRKVQIGFDDNDKEVRRTLANTTGDLRTGQVVGKLVEALRMGDPDVLDAFENNFFSNLQAGTALKYVGSSPLMPSNIETFAIGGLAGLSAEDTVPALLTPGEFVINKNAAQKIGYNQLNKLNQADKIQGYNKGGYVGVNKFRLGGLAPEQAELTRFKAEQAGISVSQFIKDVRSETLKKIQDIKDVAPKQAKLRATSIEAKERIKSLKASGASPEDQAKGLQSIKQTLIEQIKAIDPKLASTELSKRASMLMDGLDKDLNLNDIISSNAELADTFNRTVSDSEAYREAMVSMSESTGLAAASMGILVTEIDVAKDQLSKEMGAKYGQAGESFPELAEAFGETGFGQNLSKITESIDGDVLASKIGGAFTSLGSGISEGVTSQLSKVFNVPGGIPALIGGLVTTVGTIAQNFAGNSPTGQAVAGGLVTGGSYAMQGAILGQVFGPPGILAGAILGGFVGIFEGASAAFQRTDLANRLDSLSTSSTNLDDAFAELRKNLNFSNLSDAEKSLGDFSQKTDELRVISESTSGFGAYRATALGGTPTDVQQEALGAEISGRSQTATATAELSEVRLRTLSDKQIDAGANRTQSGSVDEIYNASTAIDQLTRGLAKQQGANIGNTESLEDYTKRAGATNVARLEEIRLYSLDRVAIDAYVQKRKQQGATDNQINQEIYGDRQKVVDQGKVLVAEQEKQRFKAEQLSRAVTQVTLQQEKLIDVYDRIGGALDKLLSQMDENIRQTDAYTNSLSGNASVINPNRNEEDILRNYSRYSMPEVEASADRVGNLLGGGKDATDLTGSVVAAKILKDQLPALLRENEGRGADDAIEALRKQFSDMGLGGSEAIKAALDEMETTLATEEGGIISSEVTGSAIVEKLSQTLQAGAEASVKVLETFNEGVSKANQELNKYNEALSKSDAYFAKANNIRIDSELELRKVLGKRVSMDDENRAFTEEIQSLTTGILPGGTTDPALIGDFIRRESEQRRKDVEDNSGNLPGAGGTDAAVKAQKELALRQQESAKKINDANQALEKLANNGEAAALALSKIQENQKLAAASMNYLRNVMTSDSDQLTEMNKDLNAYSTVASGTATTDDYDSLDFRQRAYRGSDAIQSLMPQQMADQMQARMTRQMLEKTNPEMLKQVAYITRDEEGKSKTVSIEESLRLAETGENEDTKILVAAYDAANERMIQANKELGNLQLTAAQTHYKQMETLFGNLNTNLTNLLANIKAQVVADAGALARPDSEKKDYGDTSIPGDPGQIKSLSKAQKPGQVNKSLAAQGVAATALLGLGYATVKSQRKPPVFGPPRPPTAIRGLVDKTREAVSSRMPKLPKLPKVSGKAAGLTALAALVAAGTAYAFSGSGKKEDSTTPSDNDLSMVEGIMNIKNATINIVGSTELAGLTMNETLPINQTLPTNIQEANAGTGLGGLAFDAAAYTASDRLVRNTIGTAANNATPGAVSKLAPGLVENASKIKGVGAKGNILGHLALGGIDMGVEAYGGGEEVFGRGGNQVYSSAQNLGSAALTTNPLVAAGNAGFDIFRTASELMYDPAGKTEGYREEGGQLLSDMQTKAEMVGDAGAYLWQATDEAAKAFVRPADSCVKLGVAVNDLAEATSQKSREIQKTSDMMQSQQKYRSNYDENTGEVSFSPRSEADNFSDLTSSQQIDARIQAAAEKQLTALNSAQTSGVKYTDFLQQEGIQTPGYMQGQSDTDLYNLQRQQIETEIAGKQAKNVNTESNDISSRRYMDAVEQRKAESVAVTGNTTSLVSNDGSSQLAQILGDLSVDVPEFTNSIDIFGNAVSVFSKLFENSSSQNNEDNSLSLDNKSMQALQGFSVSVAAFGSYVSNLSRLNIPSKIEIVGKYTFDVNITGAAAFEEMKIELTKELTELFASQIDALNKDLYDKSSGQIGSVSRPQTNVRNI